MDGLFGFLVMWIGIALFLGILLGGIWLTITLLTLGYTALAILVIVIVVSFFLAVGAYIES